MIRKNMLSRQACNSDPTSTVNQQGQVKLQQTILHLFKYYVNNLALF